MAEKLNRETIALQADVHAAPPAVHTAHVVDRTFELPRSIYGLTVGCYLGFIATMALGFRTPHLIIPMVLFAFIVVAGFGIPAIWTHLAGENHSRPLSWARFQSEGIKSLTGKNSANQATVQVLILPVLILVWGLAVVTIAAIVG